MNSATGNTTVGASPPPHDLIDQLAALNVNGATHQLRHRREKVALATEGSYDALFDPALPDLSLAERLQVAMYACRMTPAPALLAHYRARLEELRESPHKPSHGQDQQPTDAAQAAKPADRELLKAIEHGDPERRADARLSAILKFTRILTLNPVIGDRDLLQSLPAAGLSTPAIVALAQLIAFIAYQTRLVAGLVALNAAMQQAVRDSSLAAAGPAAVGGAAADASITASANVPAVSAPHTLGVLKSSGFTNETLDWLAWLDKVDIDKASAEQLAVLEESHPKAKVSDYYLFLVHQPEILRQRSIAFNAIMYAPGGMARAERELGATVVSRVNGCVYCASVHAQRFEQMAKRQDVIAQVFDNPHTAGTDEREQAIASFSIHLTAVPDMISAGSIDKLSAAGLRDDEVLDLIHSIAIFAWANRLMLNLGEPVYPV